MFSGGSDAPMDRQGSPTLQVRRWLGSLRWEVVGAAAAVAVFVGVSMSYALSTPLFYQRDEMAHLGYAHEIAGGRLPEIDTFSRVPEAATAWQARLDHAPDDRYRQVWVANHPPLHYVSTAPAIWFSNLTEREDGGLLPLRMANIAFAAVGVGLTYLLGFEISGGRRRVGFVATSLVALVPHPHQFFAQGLNDGIAFAAVVGVLWGGARYVRRGHSPRGLALLAAAVGLAAGSRAAAMLVALVVVAVVAGYQLFAQQGRAIGRLRSLAFTGGAAVLPAFVLFGWFYGRNHVLYGDIGGSSFLMDRFTREPNGSVLGFAADREQWDIMYRTLFSQTFAGSPDGYAYVDVGWGFQLVIGVSLVGLVLALLPKWVGIMPRAWRAQRPRAELVRPAVVFTLAAVALVLLLFSQHVTAGGLPHYRYLYPTLPALAVLVAVGTDRLVPRVLPTLVVGAQALLMAPLVLPTGRAYRQDATVMPEPLASIPASWAFPRAGALGVALLGAVVFVVILLMATVEPLVRRVHLVAVGRGGHVDRSPSVCKDRPSVHGNGSRQPRGDPSSGPSLLEPSLPVSMSCEDTDATV